MTGLIVFGTNSGIGNQSRRLCYMLKPDRILYVDNRSFSSNRKQHLEWFDNFKGYKVQGIPSNREIDVFLKGLSRVFYIETPLNPYLLTACKEKGIKIYAQINYEYLDHLNNDWTLPDKFLMPSYWKVEEMIEKFGRESVMYLPPPVDPGEYKTARDINFLKSGKRVFLHTVGTVAEHDRNGTLLLIQAVKLSKGDYKLVIKSQAQLPEGYYTEDRRIEYVIDDTDIPEDLYKGFDALIIPRRYGGLCLPMIEGMMSGLPVIMPNVSPNNRILPSDWLINCKLTGSFTKRTKIDMYSVDVQALANKLDELAEIDCEKPKARAFEIAYNNYSPSKLIESYRAL